MSNSFVIIAIFVITINAFLSTVLSPTVGYFAITGVLIFLSYLMLSDKQYARVYASIAIIPAVLLVDLSLPTVSDTIRTLLTYSALFFFGISQTFIYRSLDSENLKRDSLLTCIISILFTTVLTVGYYILLTFLPAAQNQLISQLIMLPFAVVSEELVFRNLIQKEISHSYARQLGLMLSIALYCLLFINRELYAIVFALISSSVISLLYQTTRKLYLSGTANVILRIILVLFQLFFLKKIVIQ